MKTLTEITNIISKQMGEVAKEAATDYDVIVCPERIFMDDYLPKAESYLQSMSEFPQEDSDSPQDLPFKNTVFVVIKLGSGQANMGVANYSCTLEVLSEEDDFTAARQLLDSYIAKYNFEYIDGIMQSYFTPDMGGSQESVYTGFRALLSCRGNVRVPEEGAVFITDVLMSFDGKFFFEVPYISVMYNHSCQPDPQAFAGTRGRTMALNRQSTQTITLDMYLWRPNSQDSSATSPVSIGPDGYLGIMSRKIIEAHSDMNVKFRLMVRTSLKDGKSLSSGNNMCSSAKGLKFLAANYKQVASSDEMHDADTLYFRSDNSEYYFMYATSKGKFFVKALSVDNKICIFDDWFILTNAVYNQQWGDISSWSLTFTSALEEEK